MNTASAKEIKTALQELDRTALQELLLRLARFKKENKELLAYLLFDMQDEAAYVNQVKEEITANFNSITANHAYFIKKTLRKILRIITKYARYSNTKETEVQLRLYFCEILKADFLPKDRQQTLLKIYESQLSKINALILLLHEDLQYDYTRQLEALE